MPLPLGAELLLVAGEFIAAGLGLYGYGAAFVNTQKIWDAGMLAKTPDDSPDTQADMGSQLLDGVFDDALRGFGFGHHLFPLTSARFPSALIDLSTC